MRRASNKKILAIIPARGGSKRLPGKNVRKLDGIPLIGWTIKAALNSMYQLEVIVSTDDPEIAKISKKFGAEIPYLRADNLASDKATSQDVVADVIEKLALDGRTYHSFLLLQPTSPLRTAKDIDGALDLFYQKTANSVISVCESEHSPLWMNKIGKNRSMNRFLPQKNARRSQDLSKYYRLNGAIYICRIDRFLKTNTFFQNQKSFAYVMSTMNSVDIDTLWDFKMAECILKCRGKE